MATPSAYALIGLAIFFVVASLLTVMVVCNAGAPSYRAMVPDIKTAKKVMATGNVRYTFEFEKGKVPAIEAGKAYRVQITEVR